MGANHDLDPREVDCDRPTGSMEELEDISISETDEERHLKLGKNLAPERRPITPEHYTALKEEVDKLLANKLIKDAHYPVWVKKKNGKWRICVDFTDLNKACPKDNFPLLRIDQLMDATASHQHLSFIDVYSGYNQIPMNPTDQEHASFITDRGLYCYKVMPFGLKNVGATYQRLVNMMFEALIGRTMEVYVDDMLIKFEQVTDHVSDLREMFGVLKSYQMKLNPLKCAFGIASRKFLGFMVNNNGIEANPDKIKALLNMRLPVRKKEYKPRTKIKDQALENFIAEFTRPIDEEAENLKGPSWELYVNRSSSEQGAGAEVMLISPEGHKILCALRFRFLATNNESEYEALLAGLLLAKEIRAESLEIFSDSQLVVNQVRGEYQAKDIKMVAYLQKNSHADALARLAIAQDAKFLGDIPVDFLATPSTEQRAETLVIMVSQNSWMIPILGYLQDGKLPEDKLEAHRLRAQAARYCIYDDKLYKRGFSAPLMRCIDGTDCQTVLGEIHASHCGNHAVALSLAQKALWQGFYWPTIKQDAVETVKRCEKCQRFTKIL
ncbi:uncharacterized protein LOC127788152 [Diospyros lotus]|uniref:uncharacterized protein LOC127788152 n=1 Tax=Diospyros lotus TaxID=55363 RepID=UPI00225020FB|nr:uncharacterized protein LOC127788152 [Diospyros lotus]